VEQERTVVPDDVQELAAAVGLADAGPALARLARPAVRLEPVDVFGRLCGYPEMAQIDDPLLWAAGRRLELPDAEVVGVARRWRLLLQVVGFDPDVVYACLPEDRLAAADFRDVEVLSQYG
jgi:hypothetical protein